MFTSARCESLAGEHLASLSDECRHHRIPVVPTPRQEHGAGSSMSTTGTVTIRVFGKLAITVGMVNAAPRPASMAATHSSAVRISGPTCERARAERAR
ncbi:MAG TPA: hypothetical protein VF136_18980 [Methylomirabilota bacterium]